MEKISQNYDPVSLSRILQGLERRIEALQQPKLRRIKSVAAEAAQNLAVNEAGYVLNDSQNLDLVVRAEDGRLYRISGQASTAAATSSSGGTTDHGSLSGLTDDDHTQYTLLAGRSGGQTIIGGTGTTDDLTLRTTAGIGASGANMVFQVGNNGATEAMRILNSGNVGIGATAPTAKFEVDGSVIFNESGNDVDFRVESDTDANALFVDASANTVQVGSATTADSAKFYVSGKLSTSGEAEINGDLNHDGSNVGFYGVTPVARPSAYTQNYSTATRTHAARTASTLTDNSAGTANTTVEALPDPADAPLTADSLRDDLTANLIPALRNNFADLAAQINALKADSDNTAQVLNSCIDDRQADGLAQ